MADKAAKAQKGAEKLGGGILPRTAAILKRMRQRIEGKEKKRKKK